MFHFYTPWKRQKTKIFMASSGGKEMATELKWIKHIVMIDCLNCKAVSFFPYFEFSDNYVM